MNKLSPFEKNLHHAELKLEAHEMLNDGVPLSVIAKTLKLKISDILDHR